MPVTVTLYSIAVWFCVGFFTGTGWTLAQIILNRLVR